MPIALELEKGADGYYRIVTAYPNSAKKIEGILIFDDSTGSSPVTATGSLIRLADDKSGVSYQGANAKISIPTISQNISQNETVDNKNLTPQPSNKTGIHFGSSGVELYKKSGSLTQSQLQKFEENMEKPVDYNGETLTRQQLVEKIAGGEIEESAVKTNAGERQYLEFLRKNITEPLKTIQSAGIAAETSKQPYHFSLAYMGGASKTIYESAVSFDEQENFSKDTETLQQLTKLAESLGGKLGKGQTNFGKDAFIFEDNGKGAETFTKAANLFTSNDHLKYLQNANPAAQVETETSNIQDKAVGNEISKFRENFTPQDFIQFLAVLSNSENPEINLETLAFSKSLKSSDNTIAMQSRAEIGLKRRAKEILEKANLDDKTPSEGAVFGNYPVLDYYESWYTAKDSKEKFPYAVKLAGRVPEHHGKPVAAIISALKKLAAQFDSYSDNGDSYEPVYHFKNGGDAVLFAKAVEMYFDNGKSFTDLENTLLKWKVPKKLESEIKNMYEKHFGKQKKITEGAGVKAGDEIYVWDDKNLNFREKDTRRGVGEFSGKDFALQYVYGYGDAEKAIQAINHDLSLMTFTYVHDSLAKAKKILQNEGQNWKANWDFKYSVKPTQSQAQAETNPRLKIGEHKHTKTGELIPSAELTERVDENIFSQLKSLAKKYGGSYSKFAKKFLFQKAEGRDKFFADANRDIFKVKPSEAENKQNVAADNPAQVQSAANSPAEKVTPDPYSKEGDFSAWDNTFNGGAVHPARLVEGSIYRFLRAGTLPSYSTETHILSSLKKQLTLPVILISIKVAKG